MTDHWMTSPALCHWRNLSGHCSTAAVVFHHTDGTCSRKTIHVRMNEVYWSDTLWMVLTHE